MSDVNQTVTSGKYHAGTNNALALKWGVTKRAASKINSGNARTNPDSPFFGFTKKQHIEALGGNAKGDDSE